MAGTGERGKRSWKRTLLWVIGILVVLFLLIQLMPYGRSSHTNPPATTPFQWTDPEAEAIARESCYDCHSNETDWWWATSIAPFSWLTQRDVDMARSRFNFSEWEGGPSLALVQEMIDGQMPPQRYTLIHRGARLTGEEKQILLQGYEASLNVNSGTTSEEPAESPSPTETAGPTPTETAGVTAIINARCTSCHPADRALDYREDNVDEAEALLDEMIQRGASLTTGEREALIQYFTQ